QDRDDDREGGQNRHEGKDQTKFERFLAAGGGVRGCVLWGHVVSWRGWPGASGTDGAAIDAGMIPKPDAGGPQTTPGLPAWPARMRPNVGNHAKIYPPSHIRRGGDAP